MYTQSGDHLGKVADFEIDPTTHSIIRYHVKGGDIIRGILQRELIISSTQVISITEEKMIVEDGTIAAQERKKEPLKGAVPVT